MATPAKAGVAISQVAFKFHYYAVLDGFQPQLAGIQRALVEFLTGQMVAFDLGFD